MTILFLVCHSILFAQESKTSFGAPPTLGNYVAASVSIGENQIVIPTAAPTNTSRTTARASSGFKGVLTVTPSNGRVRITNAQPAGTYTITVTADDGSGTTATKTFSPTITVTDSTPFAPSDSMKNLSPSANRVVSKSFQIVIQQVVTSADTSISGRASTADGQGIRNARVSVALPNGEVRTVLTGAFGYFLF